jgi:hypothetical protein
VSFFVDDRKAFSGLDGDAHRDADPRELAAEVLRWHWDIARCYCRVCVLARAVLGQSDKPARGDGRHILTHDGKDCLCGELGPRIENMKLQMEKR